MIVDQIANDAGAAAAQPDHPTLGTPMPLVVIFGIVTAWIVGTHVARAIGSTTLEEQRGDHPLLPSQVDDHVAHRDPRATT